MKAIITLQLFCFLSYYCEAQIVLNGDFEIYDTCPTGPSTPGDFQLNHCTGWYIPTDGTSDYFNTCSSSSLVSIPVNNFGYQEPKSGNGYVGLFTNEKGFASGQCQNGIWSRYYREYIQQKLHSSLEKDSIYFISFFASLADTVGGYAIKNLGLKFSDFNYQSNCFIPIITQPDIISDDFITSTKDWTKISGYYIANGNEEYITIGNFSDTLSFINDTLCVKPGSEWQDGTGLSYYYIDGVSISKVASIPIPNVITANNDGINDNIDFSKYCIGINCEITILNRWGNIVYSSINDGWIWDGKLINQGVYFYIMESANLRKTGSITLTK